MIRDFPIVTIEDAFDEDDWPNWSEFVSRVGGPVQVHHIHALNEYAHLIVVGREATRRCVPASPY